MSHSSFVAVWHLPSPQFGDPEIALWWHPSPRSPWSALTASLPAPSLKAWRNTTPNESWAFQRRWFDSTPPLFTSQVQWLRVPLACRCSLETGSGASTIWSLRCWLSSIDSLLFPLPPGRLPLVPPWRPLCDYLNAVSSEAHQRNLASARARPRRSQALAFRCLIVTVSFSACLQGMDSGPPFHLNPF